MSSLPTSSPVASAHTPFELPPIEGTSRTSFKTYKPRQRTLSSPAILPTQIGWLYPYPGQSVCAFPYCSAKRWKHTLYCLYHKCSRVGCGEARQFKFAPTPDFAIPRGHRRARQRETDSSDEEKDNNAPRGPCHNHICNTLNCTREKMRPGQRCQTHADVGGKKQTQKEEEHHTSDGRATHKLLDSPRRFASWKRRKAQ